MNLGVSPTRIVGRIEVDVERGGNAASSSFGEQALVAAFEHCLREPHVRPQQMCAAVQSGHIEILETKRLIVRQATQEMSLAVV